MSPNKKQCLLCGQTVHLGPCNTRELFLPVIGEETCVDEEVNPFDETIHVVSLGDAIREMVTTLLRS